MVMVMKIQTRRKRRKRRRRREMIKIPGIMHLIYTFLVGIIVE